MQALAQRTSRSSPVEGMIDDSVRPDPAGRIPLGARVDVMRREQRETATVIDNQGPAYLVRFDDGVEAWCDRPGVERDNPHAADWPETTREGAAE